MVSVEGTAMSLGVVTLSVQLKRYSHGMPAPRHKLEGIVQELVANYPGWGPERLRQHLEEAARRAGMEPVGLPSVSTIARIKRELSPPDRVPLQYVRWPESFSAGILPWEAAASIFELLQHRTRPVTTGEAQWYWRVTLARPDVSVPDRAIVARVSAACDRVGAADGWRIIESFLAGRVGISEVLHMRIPVPGWTSDVLAEWVRAGDRLMATWKARFPGRTLGELADLEARYPGRTLDEIADLEEQNDSQG